MKKILFALLLTIVLAAGLRAQQPPKPVDDAERRAVVVAAADALARLYVFPDVARRMGDLIRRNLKAGTYKELSDPRAFAERLAADLRSISSDRHLGVRFAPERILEIRTPDEAKKKAAEELRKRTARMENHGFREVKLLEGNVGYLKFDYFSADPGSFPVAVGAMAFLANCDALIIDLRENGGGSPEMIQLISSYLFDGEPRHLNSFHYRLGDKVEQSWTLPYVPGTKLADVDLYVLTSRFTFSGAEEFTYNLKNMKRAAIVGETTGGGAHPQRMEILSDRFAMSIPFARAVNPISGTNWEGTGVEPDVKVPADQALDKARQLALGKLATNEKNERIRSGYQWALEGLQAGMNPVILTEEVMKSYAGGYGFRKITFENGVLYYQRENGPRMKMIPMADDLFRFDELGYFRVRIVRKDGRITGIEGRYNDGGSDFSAIDG